MVFYGRAVVLQPRRWYIRLYRGWRSEISGFLEMNEDDFSSIHVSRIDHRFLASNPFLRAARVV